MSGFDFNAQFVEAAPEAKIEDDPLYVPTDMGTFTADDHLIDEVIQPKQEIMTRDEHIRVLKEKVVRVTFTKVDGTARTMDVTLREDMLPPHEESESTKAINPDVVSAYEINEQHWKSFRVDSVIQVLVL